MELAVAEARERMDDPAWESFRNAAGEAAALEERVKARVAAGDALVEVLDSISREQPASWPVTGYNWRKLAHPERAYCQV